MKHYSSITYEYELVSFSLLYIMKGYHIRGNVFVYNIRGSAEKFFTHVPCVAALQVSAWRSSWSILKARPMTCTVKGFIEFLADFLTR